MKLYANELHAIRQSLVDFVRENKVTIILPKARPVVESPEPNAPHIIDYIGLIGAR